MFIYVVLTVDNVSVVFIENWYKFSFLRFGRILSMTIHMQHIQLFAFDPVLVPTFFT